MVGGGPEKRLLRGYVIRAFSHRGMASVCRGFAQKNPGQNIREVLVDHNIPDDLINMADTFCDLQNERHEADYNFARRYTKEEVMIICGSAKTAHQKWQNIKDDKTTKSFLVALLVQQNLKTSR